MNVDLNKEDLISLVMGTSPNYDLMQKPDIQKLGSYSGSYDRWSWNSSLNELTESQLYKLYLRCKRSWS